MRAPNGYGSVVKLSGKRRNPFAVRKTTGWTEKGYPIYKILGYYETREAGMIALAEYNKSPYDIDAANTTLQMLFDKFVEKKMSKISISTQGAFKSAYKHMLALAQMKYKDIKSFHMQDIIDHCGRSYATQGHIKSLFGHLDKFALEIDVINKGYAQLTTAEPIPETSKRPFTDAEVLLLWDNIDIPFADTILILTYTGFRISELLDLKAENVNLADKTLTGGTKTRAGKNRIIPIHSKIYDLVKSRYYQKNEFLIAHEGKKLTEYYYYKFWDEIMNKLSMDHTPHECRHTFRSLLDNAGANKVCIDMLMGHKSKEVGERVYTHKTLEQLRENIELITL